MPTKRTPIHRDSRRVITPAVVAAFERWRRARGEEESAAAYSELHDLLHAKPWEWPAVENPRARCPFPPGCHAAEQWERKRAANPEPPRLWRELARLAKAARTATDGEQSKPAAAPATAQAPRRTRSRRLPRNLS